MTRRSATLRTALAVVSVGLLGTAAPTQLPDPGAAPWEPLHFRSIERHTSYLPSPAGESGAVRATAECAASALVLSLGAVDLARTPVLRWRWRILQPLEAGDERSKAGDDFAARVYVMFRFEPERATLFQRARRQLGESFFGTEMPGTALSFVWTAGIEPGEIWTNPHAKESMMVSLASGASEGWREASVDVTAAYQRAFGHAPPVAFGLGIMTDADDTCQSAVAEYADFRFTAGPADPTNESEPR